MKCGGVSDVKPADDEVQGHCDAVKEALCEKLGKAVGEVAPFTAISYTSQVVAGVNFFVKIKVSDGGDCVHARIFRPLPHTGNPVKLDSVQAGKKEEDQLEYF